MDHAVPTGAISSAIPALILYSKAGCHLCEETRAFLEILLARRATLGLAAPAITERDIESDPAWERAFFSDIPVIEIDNRRMTLATSPLKIEQLIAEAFGG
jgi:glutaredoxin